MSTYYRDGSVQVTASEIKVGGLTYPIAELGYVWHRRGRLNLRVTARLTARFGLIGTLIAPIAAGVYLRTRAVLAEPSLTARIGVALALLAVGAVLLLLLRTTDAAKFGKVYRAIERAIEAHTG